ncbi:copper amine oxidase N-terminal domain-containing protein [Paenibacillus albicereus]|uniref:Copper amine oxidase N-terminal domain-containing protein n=1 Tax=Paenibacillus albicereus TaxID=2726185 RepID=A0A6H2H083_9BACL|nr:copper amine oxidase N-terminal domain-containing protein [Paenibacillus albicereus]QJC52826.1 copper amine oxidase N-terminal domain-containing protein [Paenibacillus albicereus]
MSIKSTYRSKKAAGLLLAGILIAGAGAAAPSAEAAKDAPKVLVNGLRQTLDHDPIVKDGRTLVPLRGIFEAMGATVDWDQYEQTIQATRGKNEIFLQVNKTKAKVNDMEIELSVPAQNMSGTTMVPLRFIAEALGAYCVYYPDQNLITITDRVES